MTDRDERLLDAFLDDLGTAPVPPDLARSVSRRIREQQPARASRLAAWWGLAAAAVAILAIGGLVFVVAGPKPSPSVSAVPPSASSSVAPSVPVTPVPSNLILVTPAPSPIGTPLPFPTPTAGPSDTPSPSAAPTFHVTLDPSGLPLPVLVTDNSATLESTAGVKHNLTTNDPIEVVQGSSPNAVIVGWLGGGCDLYAEVSIDAARTTVTEATLTTNQGCDAIGVERAVQLTFVQPVAAASLEGRLGVPLGLHPALSPSAVAFTDATHGYLAGTDLITGLAYYTATDDIDGKSFYADMPIGWGTVTGIAVTVDATGSAFPVVAISCSATDTPDPGCVPGIYLGPGPRFGRMSDADPKALAAQGSHLAALVVGPMDPLASYPFPQRRVTVSADAGQTWRTVDSPCPDLEATGIAIDGQDRVLVVCEGSAATGSARKTMYRSLDASATSWAKLPAPPEAGTGFQMSLATDATGLMWGPRSPLLQTKTGGASWVANSVADGDVRIVVAASALPEEHGVLLVWDGDRQRVLLLRNTYGFTWTELIAFPPPSF